MITVVFVRPQENFLAMTESGKIFANSPLAWSLVRKLVSINSTCTFRI